MFIAVSVYFFTVGKIDSLNRDLIIYKDAIRLMKMLDATDYVTRQLLRGAE